MQTEVTPAQKVADEFLDAAAPYWDAVQANASVSYFALSDEAGGFTLTRGRMFLGTEQRQIAGCAVESDNIRAGHFLVRDAGGTPRSVIHALLQGRLDTPAGVLHYPGSDNHHYFADRQRFHPEGSASGKRLDVLSIAGGSRPWQVHAADLDWELRAAATPYDSVAGLLAELQAGTLHGNTVLFETVTPNVAEVNFSSSINGRSARLSMYLANGLDTKLASLGYCIHHSNRIVSRGSIDGTEMTWDRDRKIRLQRGTARLRVPAGAVAHCFARFAGVAQHQAWIADPSFLPNPLRSIYEAFDPGLARLNEVVQQAGQRGTNAREFEQAASWLLALLGFRVIHLGNNERSQDAVDLMAIAPNDNCLLLECTTGVLKSDKLSLLAMRAEAVRAHLGKVGNAHIRILPVMATSRPRQEVLSSIGLAAQQGILVLTAESITQGLQQSTLRQDANDLFNKVEAALADLRAAQLRKDAVDTAR